MNRRGFLGALTAAVAGATLDPERLLWEPGKKLISIPKPKPLNELEKAYERFEKDRISRLIDNEIIQTQLVALNQFRVGKSFELC